MEIDWGPPGSTSRSFETNVPELRDPQHYNVTNSTPPLRGGTAGEAVNSTSASNNLMAGLWLLVVVLTCLLSSPQYPDARYRRGRQIREEARRRRQLRDEQQKRLQQVSDPSQRRKMVEDSLEIQRVTSSRGGVLTLEPMERTGDDDLEGGDERNGLHLQLTYGDESCGDDGEEDNDANQSSSICAICLEPFEVGHVVAWSRPKQPHLDPECSHVFHRCVCRPLHALPCLFETKELVLCSRVVMLITNYRDCICPWLQDASHDDCPSCRAVLFHYHDEGKSVDDEIILVSAEDGGDEDGRGDDDPSSGSLFVIIHGLVSRARQASYNIMWEQEP
jgi:hypothetical protein